MVSRVKYKKSAFKVIKVFGAIQRWEHWHEIQLCAEKEYAMSAGEFYRLLPEYQRFIALTAAYEGVGMLSTEVDKLWHAHILNTKRYYDFCQQYLGRIIHHLPCSSYVLYGCDMNGQTVRCNTPPNPPIPPTPPIPPSCNVMSSGETVSEIRDTILTAADGFYRAYKECYEVEPSPHVWERLALLHSTEGVTV